MRNRELLYRQVPWATIRLETPGGHRLEQPEPQEMTRKILEIEPQLEGWLQPGPNFEYKVHPVFLATLRDLLDRGLPLGWRLTIVSLSEDRAEWTEAQP